MKPFPEVLARLFVIGLLVGLLMALIAARYLDTRGVIDVHASLPEKGGWDPDNLTVKLGQPLHLRLTSDDVMHGFAVGQSDWPAVDLKPGQVSEVTLVFEQPGRYTFYCTRWCGPNHWRMRGSIHVEGTPEDEKARPSPLYVDLGLDIDAEHQAEVIPEQKPSARRGEALGATIPAKYFSRGYYQATSPAATWLELRREPSLDSLSDQQVWDLVAFIRRANSTPEALAEGEALYTANCAACHGETGAGDGVMAQALARELDDLAAEHSTPDGHTTAAPTDFSDAEHMLGASPALLHGKIVRGGMGTGMPYWGPIFTEEQIWAIVSYLWKFQLISEVEP